MEELGLQPGRTSAEATPEYQTLELMSRVREARLRAGDTRREAGKVLLLALGTTVEVCRTRKRTFRALDKRRQAARSSVIARELVRPCAAVTAARDDMPAESADVGRLGSSQAALRRAVAFIDEHAAQEITAADIAGASFVTVRAVQLAFRRYMGMTPTEYLRQTRLDRAHRDLIAADPTSDSVTAVAYRWGFASASRFASYYYNAFGTLPSHTLRSRPVRDHDAASARGHDVKRKPAPGR